jgi:hypothetical protein
MITASLSPVGRLTVKFEKIEHSFTANHMSKVTTSRSTFQDQLLCTFMDHLSIPRPAAASAGILGIDLGGLPSAAVLSEVPRTRQSFVTLTVHTNKINPATTPTATSAASTTNGHPVVVIQRGGQQASR